MAPPSSRTAAGIAIRIVGPQGEPLEGAQVFVLANASKSTIKRFWDSCAIDALMESEGQLQVTDAAGVLTVPAPQEGRTLILARWKKLWGSVALADDPERVEPVDLALELDVTLRVRVVDILGRPAPGVMVELLQVDDWDFWPVIAVAAEGDRAIAVLRHVQEYFEETDECHWVLALDVLCQDRAEYKIDPLRPPHDIVTLALPAAGSVELRVYGEDRHPFVGSAHARLGIVREGEHDALSPIGDTDRRTVDRPVIDGAVRFPFVEPGQRLEIAVRRAYSEVATRVYGSGPISAGQTSSFDVFLGTDHPVVLLRALDDAGRPLTNTDLRITVTTDGNSVGYTGRVRVHTDADGSFLLDLEGNVGEGQRRELIVSRKSGDLGDIQGRVDASAHLRDGVNDLGIVRLRPLPPFVAGRVVSSAGEPIAGARLMLQTCKVGSSHWLETRNFKHSSDVNGRFEVRAVLDGDRLRIGATSKDSAGRLREFVRGDADILIELDLEGALEGRVLLDDDFPDGLLRLEITGDVSHLDYSERRAKADEHGVFRIGGLLSGMHDLALRFAGHNLPFDTVPGIMVEAGATTRDERLDPLDLRGRLRSHHVSLVPPDDEKGLEGEVRFGAAGSEELEAFFWFNEREFWIVSEHELIDVVISTSRHLSERLQGVGGEIRVPLRPRPRVRLLLASEVQIPEPPVFIKAVLAPMNESDAAIDWRVAAFDEHRKVWTRAPGWGEMKVVWIVERRSPHQSVSSRVAFETPQMVEVREVLDQQIEVTLTPEQLEKLIQNP